jgi:dolichol-phosphate mannosyltransferase
MISDQKPLISICVPVYNEELNIEPFYSRVLSVIDGLSDQYRFEMLFTDNHSTDATFERLAELSKRDNRVRVIRFSRNFGFQRSILTNYINARGVAAIQLDVDLQDPPELIADFLKHWEDGYKVVYGIRRERPNESFWLHGARKAFYRVVDFLSEDALPHDAGDFRLVDRCVLDQLKLVSDQQPYLRGLIASMGFRQAGIVYDRAARERGASKFNIVRLCGLALDGILQHSVVPLRIAIVLGLVLSGLAAFGGVYYLLSKLFFGADWPPGIATSTLLILLSIGMNALLLGIIGEYIGRIYKNVKRMPITISEIVIDYTGPSEGSNQDGPREWSRRAHYISGH